MRVADTVAVAAHVLAADAVAVAADQCRHGPADPTGHPTCRHWPPDHAMCRHWPAMLPVDRDYGSSGVSGAAKTTLSRMGLMRASKHLAEICCARIDRRRVRYTRTRECNVNTMSHA